MRARALPAIGLPPAPAAALAATMPCEGGGPLAIEAQASGIRGA